MQWTANTKSYDHIKYDTFNLLLLSMHTTHPHAMSSGRLTSHAITGPLPAYNHNMCLQRMLQKTCTGCLYHHDIQLIYFSEAFDICLSSDCIGR